MTFQKIKPWLVLALIFILGVVTGISLTIGLGPRFMHRPGMPMKGRLLMGLTHRLNLTADQQAKIDPILTDAENQIQSVHRDEIGRITRIMETANNQILPILTPEQKPGLLKIEKEMERERDRMMPGHMRPWMMQPGQPPHMMSPPPPEDMSPPQNGSTSTNAPQSSPPSSPPKP